MTDTIDVAALVEFANEAAAYFEKRPTGDEDLAHWSNAYNAENCRKIATALQYQADALAEARREAEKMGRLMLPEATAAAVRGHQLCMEAFNEVNRRMLTAEASLATMREAMEEIAHSAETHSHVIVVARAALAKEGK